MKGTFASAQTFERGTLWMARTPRGICNLVIGGTRHRFRSSLPRGDWTEDARPFRAITAKLRRFASGKRVAFDVPLDLSLGTPFQQKVWRAIAKIPWGETRSYAELARAVGKPSAYRAVANACGANPVPLIIPCHRVIASDGSIGGFSGGIALKRELLGLEGILK